MKRFNILIPVVLCIAVVAGVIFYSSKSKKLLSPLPEAPDFEVVFYTPVPEGTTPTSTPSATPKGQKSGSTPTVKPTNKPSVSPTAKQSTPSVQSASSPTKSNTPTPTKAN
jgi:hypothetical protein